ncbi:spore wall assembly-related protein [Cryptococcus neoformans Bt63]|nr:spore wall assembly-related protein [Cryptococcus neoformans var. grubii Bt63]
MPPVPHPPARHYPNQNSPPPLLKPSPAIVKQIPPPRPPADPSLHVLPRRFLGPIPEKVLNSSHLQEKRRHFYDLRRRAAYKVRHELIGRKDSLSGLEEDDADEGIIRRAALKIRVPGLGRDEDREENLGPESDHESETYGPQTTVGKEVWFGESFDIGREFVSEGFDNDEPSFLATRDRQAVRRSGSVDRNRTQKYTQHQRHLAPHRPSNATRSTEETFFTARSRNSEESSIDDCPTPVLEHTPDTQLSPSSSVQPLIRSTKNHADQRPPQWTGPNTKKGKGPADQSVSSSTFAVPQKLKSAFRHASESPVGAVELPGIDKSRATDLPQRAKSVQFPMDPTHPLASETGKMKVRGRNIPVDPNTVLSRAGEEAQGTSSGAAADAMAEEEDKPQEPLALQGNVLYKDRMLVRVGYHREENIASFDEAAQRRNPCSKLEPFEEYIVVWRKGFVEFYQEWRMPLRERMTGTKRFCFAIPLLPHRSSLSIFNPDDLTLCLTTSVEKLQLEVEAVLKSSKTSRISAVKDRVAHSSQAQWLRGHKKGTQIFILKLPERSRALDWYWELWRDLGGRLPERFDILVPVVSTSIRMNISEEVDNGQADSGQLLRHFCPGTVITTSWETLRKKTAFDDIIQQARLQRIKDEVDLQLVWKASDGVLDWVAYLETVEGKKRPWALLAGLARLQNNPSPRELQLRLARHQPKSLKLEDGTILEEPPGIEGYLFRTHGPATRSTIYLASHDGCLFITNMRDSEPPLLPNQEGSTPSKLFSEVHREFLENERRRMGSVIRRSAGCIDMRDITMIQYPSPAGKDTDGRRDTFELGFTAGGSMKLEAHTPEIAQEWVERLEVLKSYWSYQHRIEARQRMDAMSAASVSRHGDGTDEFLGEIWNWCIIRGCRPICLSGRLYMKHGAHEKFRLKYMALTQGSFVSFEVTGKASFHVRKKNYPLFGAYTYSGLLAHDEIHEPHNRDAFLPQHRVYQDGLQSFDGPEDTTFCIRLAISGSRSEANTSNPWDSSDYRDHTSMKLSKSPTSLLIFRARSKLERDRWVWAINAEVERQARAHLDQQNLFRTYGKVIDRW